MMIKHLRDLLRAYWREHGSDHIKTQKTKLLIYDEYLKKYVSAEELLIPAELKKVNSNGGISLNKSKELWIFDVLLKKFINPKLDLLTPGINNANHLSHIYDFKTAEEHFTSSVDYFWGNKKGHTNRHTPKLPPVHDTSNNPQDTNSKVGWAGQVTKKPVTNPRPEQSKIECSFGPGKDPGKKKPQKKKELKKKLIVCNKRSKTNESLVEKSKKNTDSNINSTFPKSKLYEDEDCFRVLKEDIKGKSKSNKNEVKHFNCNLNDSQDITSGTTLQFKKNDICLNTNRANLEKKGFFKKICDQLFFNKKCSEDKLSLKGKLSKNKQVFNQSNTNIVKESCKSCNAVMDKPNQGNESISNVDPKTLICIEQRLNNSVCNESKSSKIKDDQYSIKTSESFTKDTSKNIKKSFNENVTTNKIDDDEGLKTNTVKEIDDSNINKIKKECKKTLPDNQQVSCKQNIKSYQTKTEHKNVLICKTQCSEKNMTVNTKYNFMVLPNTSNFQDCVKKINITEKDYDGKNQPLSTQSKNISVHLEPRTNLNCSDICKKSNDNVKAITCMKSESSICETRTNDLNISSLPKLSKEQSKKQSKEDAVKESSIKKRQELSRKSLKYGLIKPTQKEYDMPDSKELKDNDYCRSQNSTADKNRNISTIKKTKTLPSLQCQYIEQRVSEKLQNITQGKYYNEAHLPVDLSKQKCGSYMGFKIKKSASEKGQHKVRCVIASKSKAKSTKKVSCDNVETPNKSTDFNKSKSCKSSKLNKRREKLKTNKTKKCLSKDIGTKSKSVKPCMETKMIAEGKGKNVCSTYINKKESEVKIIEISSNEIKKNTGTAISCENELVDNHCNTLKEESKDSLKTIDQEPNESCAQNADQFMNNDTSNPGSISRQNINVDLNSSNTYERRDRFNDEIQENNTNKCQSFKDTIVDQEELKNQCSSDTEKNIKDDCLNEKLDFDVSETLQPHSTEEKLVPKESKPSPSAVQITGKEKYRNSEKKYKIINKKSYNNVSKKIKQRSQSENPWKRNTSKESKKSKGAKICTTTTSKTQLTKNKSKRIQKNIHSAKDSSMSTKQIDNTKTKRSSSRKSQHESIKSTVKQSKSVKNAVICSKSSLNITNSNKETLISTPNSNKYNGNIIKTNSSESVPNISKTHVKKSRSNHKSMKESKNNKMCSLQTLKKRVTEEPVKVAKRVEIKSFSELKLVSNSPVERLPINTVRNYLCRTESNKENKYFTNYLGVENAGNNPEQNNNYQNSSSTIKSLVSNVKENEILKNNDGTTFSTQALESIKYRSPYIPIKSLNNKYFPKHITKETESKLKTLDTVKNPQLYLHEKTQIINKENKTNEEYVSKNFEYFSNKYKNNSSPNTVYSGSRKKNMTKNESNSQTKKNFSNENKIENIIVKESIETTTQKQSLKNKCSPPKINVIAGKYKNTFNNECYKYVSKTNNKMLDIKNEFETQNMEDLKYKFKNESKELFIGIKTDIPEMKGCKNTEAVGVCGKHTKNLKGSSRITFITGLNTTRKCSIKNEFKIPCISNLHKKGTNKLTTENCKPFSETNLDKKLVTHECKSSRPKSLSIQFKDTVNQTDKKTVTSTKTKPQASNKNTTTHETKYSANKYNSDLNGGTNKLVTDIENKSNKNKQNILELKKSDENNSYTPTKNDNKSLGNITVEKENLIGEHTPGERIALRNTTYNYDSKEYNNESNIYSDKKCVKREKNTTERYRTEQENNNKIYGGPNKYLPNPFNIAGNKKHKEINSTSFMDKDKNVKNTTVSKRYTGFQCNKFDVLNPKTADGIKNISSKSIFNNLSKSEKNVKLKNKNATGKTETVIDTSNNQNIASTLSPDNPQHLHVKNIELRKTNQTMHLETKKKLSFLKSDQHHPHNQYSNKDSDKSNSSYYNYPQFNSNTMINNNHDTAFNKERTVSKNTTGSKDTNKIHNIIDNMSKLHELDKFPIKSTENKPCTRKIMEKDTLYNTKTRISNSNEVTHLKNNLQRLNCSSNSLPSSGKFKYEAPKSNTVLMSDKVLGNEINHYNDEGITNIKTIQYLKETKKSKENKNILKSSEKEIIKCNNKIDTKIITSTATSHSIFPLKRNKIMNLILTKEPSAIKTHISDSNSIQEINSTSHSKIVKNNVKENNLNDKAVENLSKKNNGNTKGIVPWSSYSKTIKKSSVDKKLRKIAKKHLLMKKQLKKNIKKVYVSSTKNIPSNYYKSNLIPATNIPSKHSAELLKPNLTSTDNIPPVEIKVKRKTHLNSFTNKLSSEDKKVEVVTINKTKTFPVTIPEATTDKIPKRSNIQNNYMLVKESTNKCINKTSVDSNESNKKKVNGKTFKEPHMKGTTINYTGDEFNKFGIRKSRKTDCSLELQKINSDNIIKAKAALAPSKKYTSIHCKLKTIPPVKI